MFRCAYTFQNCKRGQAEAFFSEVGIINGLCLKTNCKPQCSGESNCRAFLASVDPNCLEKAIGATEKEFSDHDAKHVIGDFGKFLLRIAKARKACNSHSCPM